jgi:sugar/nucleoside kinase (ribokinase family)
MKKVLILGGSTFDHIVHLLQLPQPVPQTIHVAPFHEACGSTGTGKALALKKLAVPVTLYTAYGNDFYGEKVEHYLHQNEIRTVVVKDPAGTQRHINIMDTDGNRISMFITQSSETLQHDEALVKQLIDEHDIIVLNIIPYCKQLIPLITASGKPVWTDLHDYDGSNPYHQPFVDAAHYIHLSSDNLADYKPVMQRLKDAGKELVTCTHGRKGATLLNTSGGWLQQDAVPDISIVDSNGAGDSFFSGFLYGFLRNESLQTAMEYGAICGALAVMDKNLVYASLSPELLLKLHQNGVEYSHKVFL